MDEELPTRPANTTPRPGDELTGLVWLVSYSEDDDRELDAKQIAEALSLGEISLATIVWRDGMAGWLAISQVEALAPLVEQHMLRNGTKKRTVVGGFGRSANTPTSAVSSSRESDQEVKTSQPDDIPSVSDKTGQSPTDKLQPKTPLTSSDILGRRKGEDSPPSSKSNLGGSASAHAEALSEKPEVSQQLKSLEPQHEARVVSAQNFDEPKHSTTEEFPVDSDADFGDMLETTRMPLTWTTKRVTLLGTGSIPEERTNANELIEADRITPPAYALAPPLAQETEASKQPRRVPTATTDNTQKVNRPIGASSKDPTLAMARPSRPPPRRLPNRAHQVPDALTPAGFIASDDTVRLPEVAHRDAQPIRTTTPGAGALPPETARPSPVSLSPNLVQSLPADAIDPAYNTRILDQTGSKEGSRGIFDVALEPSVEEPDIPITVEPTRPSQDRIRESFLAGPASVPQRPSIQVGSLVSPTVPQFSLDGSDATRGTINSALDPVVGSSSATSSNKTSGNHSMAAAQAMPASHGAMDGAREQENSSRKKRGGLWKVLLPIAALVGAGAGAGAFFLTQKTPEDTPTSEAIAKGEQERQRRIETSQAPHPEPTASSASSQEREPAVEPQQLPSAPPTSKRTKPKKKAGTSQQQRRSAATLPKTAPPTKTAPLTKTTQERKPEPERKPDSTAKPATPTQPFNAGAAKSAVGAAARSASTCRGPSDPSGVARVSVTFSTSGRAVRAIIQGPPFAGTKTGSCIAARMRGARVPPFTGERVTVRKKVVIQ